MVSWKLAAARNELVAHECQQHELMQRHPPVGVDHRLESLEQLELRRFLPAFDRGQREINERQVEGEPQLARMHCHLCDPLAHRGKAHRLDRLQLAALHFVVLRQQ